MTGNIFEGPSVEKLTEGVKFIDDIVQNDPDASVYVHCKAGQTRSATLVACYLMEKNMISPEEAVEMMKSKRRPKIILHTKQWEALRAFHSLLYY